uniref:Ubiquinone biosynthesis O-methyltransferase n=1 Tax=uncultured SAR11 cluster bacterium HF0770_37D02 TaxID=710726 RepID=E0XYX0_9PROT|nr:2-polyprenyl-3-methyl-5-hydroxy-6-metoxy-1,4-benzoquinol methylase [uncultured SAR11 cluster bacterium HF0770_37D02]
MTTIDKTEVEKFSKLAKDWWNPSGKFKPLHLFNPTRIKFIKEKLIYHFGLDPKTQEPLKKINILDIGCGGGLLCEPLKRLGATVTGIDASKNNIEVARLHAKEMNLSINYIHCSPEDLTFKNKFDVILNMEVIEHVSNVNLFIQDCSKLIGKNGIMFVATLNKNLKSYIYAILVAEYFLRWLPIGTHDWNKFLTPQELEIIATKNNFIIDEVVGMKFNLLLKRWYKSNDPSVNYITTFLKN